MLFRLSYESFSGPSENRTRISGSHWGGGNYVPVLRVLCTDRYTMGPFSPDGGRTRSLGMAPFENVFSNRSPTRYPISPQGLPQGWIEHPVFCLQNKRFTTKLLGLLLLHCEISLSHPDAPTLVSHKLSQTTRLSSGFHLPVTCTQSRASCGQLSFSADRSSDLCRIRLVL